MDEGTLVIKENKLSELKMKLDEVLAKAQMQDREEVPSDDDE